MFIFKERKGFTLIELLVVIAIIAILAAILFPVMTRAKKRGALATCMSNMRQMTFAILQYADDNQGRMPRINNLYTYASNQPYQDVKNRVKNQKVFNCKECIHANTAADPQPEVTYRFNPDAIRPDGVPKMLTECKIPRLFYIVADRHSTHHMIDKASPQKQWQMPMGFADGHVRGDVRIYAGEWMDRAGNYKPYHWDFPNCHLDKDPYVVTDYY